MICIQITTKTWNKWGKTSQIRHFFILFGPICCKISLNLKNKRLVHLKLAKAKKLYSKYWHLNSSNNWPSLKLSTNSNLKILYKSMNKYINLINWYKGYSRINNLQIRIIWTINNLIRKYQMRFWRHWAKPSWNLLQISYRNLIKTSAS